MPGEVGLPEVTWPGRGAVEAESSSSGAQAPVYNTLHVDCHYLNTALLSLNLSTSLQTHIERGTSSCRSHAIQAGTALPRENAVHRAPGRKRPSGFPCGCSTSWSLLKVRAAGQEASPPGARAIPLPSTAWVTALFLGSEWTR